MPKLENPKEELFANEYVKDFNASRSAIAVGHAEKGAGTRGYEYLQKPSVQKRISELVASRAKRARIEADDVLRDLIEIKDRCMEAVPVEDSEGNPIPGQWTFNASPAIRSLELLGKHLGMFTEKVETDHSGTIEVVVRDWRSKKTNAADSD